MIGGVLLIAAIALIVFLVKGMGGKPEEPEPETETTSVPETELQKEVMYEGGRHERRVAQLAEIEER